MNLLCIPLCFWSGSFEDIISFRTWILATILWNMLYNGKDHLQASKTIQRKKIRYFLKPAGFLFLCNLSAWHTKYSVFLTYHTTALLLSCCIRILELLMAEFNCNFTFLLEAVCVIPTAWCGAVVPERAYAAPAQVSMYFFSSSCT